MTTTGSGKEGVEELPFVITTDLVGLLQEASSRGHPHWWPHHRMGPSSFPVLP
jgi:hypothetical protein